MSRLTSTSGTARLGAIALLAVVFVAGGVAGVAWQRSREPGMRSLRGGGRADEHQGRDSVVSDERREGGRSRRGGGGSQFPWFFDSLGLSSQQRVSIDSIMRVNRPRTDAIMDQVMPRLRAVSDSTRAAIDAVLTPEQLAKLKAMPRRDFRRRPGGPGPRDSGNRQDRSPERPR